MKILLVLLIALTAVGVATPSTAFIQDDDVCFSVIQPAVEQARQEMQQAGPIFGCERTSNDGWRMRKVESTQPNTGSSDSMSGPVRHLLARTDGMSSDTTFRGVIWFNRYTSSLYTIGPGGVVNETDLSDHPIGYAPNWLNNYVNTYNQSMQTYLTNKAGEAPELIEYIQWFMARRDSILSTVAAQMSPMSKSAFLSNWGHQQFPWFWQLADPVTISTYLQDAEPAQASSESAPTGRSTSQSQELALTPDRTSVRPGEVVVVTIEYPPILRGVDSIAFMYYGERMYEVTLPRYLLDQDGDFACSSGYDNDIVPPLERATSLMGNPGFPPTQLELEVDPSAQSGDRLSLCVEVVGFSGEATIFAWNARVDISVID